MTHTPMFEMKHTADGDGDYTTGLVICPSCAPAAYAEGFTVSAQVISPATCQSCGRSNTPVPPYAVRKALRDKTLAVGRE